MEDTNTLRANKLNALKTNKKDNTSSGNEESEYLNAISIPIPKSSIEVEQYCKDNNISIDGKSFYKFYKERGWKLDGTPIRNWKYVMNTIAEKGIFTSYGVTQEQINTIKQKGQREIVNWMRDEEMIVDECCMREIFERIGETYDE